MKIIVKYALIFIGIIIVLAGASVSLALIYRNAIVKSILASVAQNNHIEFEAKDVNLVLSTNLKNTKLVFNNVEIKSKGDSVPIGIFSAQTEALGVEVDLLSFLLRREVKIDKITVANGSFLLRPNQNSTSQNKSSDTENLLRSLKLLSVQNFIVYIQDGKNISKVTIDKAALQLASSKAGVNSKVKGAFTFEQMNAKGESTQPAMNIEVETSGLFAQGIFNFDESKLVVDGLRLTAKGDLSLQPFGRVNLNVSARGVNIEKTLPKVRRYATIKELERATGKLDVSANISGDFSGKGKIKISAQGNISRSEVKVKNVDPITIHNLNYSLYSNDIKIIKSYSCEIQKANVLYHGFDLGGDVSVSSFGAPTYSATITFSGDVKVLKLDAIPEGKVAGSASIKATEWSYQGIEKLEALVDVSQLKAMLLQEPYIINGEFFASKQSLTPKISLVSSIVNGEFEGKIQNYLPYLFDSKKPSEIKITGTLNANTLDLDKLFLQESDGKSMLSVYTAIDAQAKEMKLFGENCTNSSARVHYNNSATMVSKLKTNVYGGVLEGDLKIYTPKNSIKKLNIDLYFNGLEISKLTFLNKNFNLKPGSVQGSCDGAISLNSNFDEKGLDFENAFGTVNFTVHNGRLLEFEPIQKLSGYIKKKLLQDVKFSALRNTISIEKGAIIIPRMEIRSTALNTYVSGKHLLNGDFDYHLTLFVSELLLQKNRAIENPIRDEKTKLFLRFTSKNGKTDVSLDSQEWGKNFEKKMQREAAEIQTNSKSTRSKEDAAAAPKADKMTFEWDEQPLEEKQPEVPKMERKKGPKPKSEVGIEWDE